MTSHERHGALNRRQSDCFKQFVRANLKETIKAPHYWPFVKGILRWNTHIYIYIHAGVQGQYCGNRFHILKFSWHYNDVIMSSIASPITSLTIVYSTVYSDTDQRKQQSSASLAFVRGIHRGSVNSPAQMASNAENVSIWWCHLGSGIESLQQIQMFLLSLVHSSLTTTYNKGMQELKTTYTVKWCHAMMKTAIKSTNVNGCHIDGHRTGLTIIDLNIRWQSCKFC